MGTLLRRIRDALGISRLDARVAELERQITALEWLHDVTEDESEPLAEDTARIPVKSRVRRATDPHLGAE